MSQVIQWYPGHMAKARRQATEQLKHVDIVLELVDARIPESSRNPVIQEIIQDKPSIIVLNKMDLADPGMTRQWLNYYADQGQPALAIDAQHHKGLRQLTRLSRQMMADTFADLEAKGVKPRPIRLMILGIPNVGKSTLINRLVGKNQAQTGNKPGVTRAQRWLKIQNNFELLDTPGILWPKIEDPEVAKKLAVTGAVTDKVLYMDDLALYLIDQWREFAPQSLERYQISPEEVENTSSVDLLLEITEHMGLRDDYDTASQRLVHEFRTHRLGNLTLDQVPEASHL